MVCIQVRRGAGSLQSEMSSPRLARDEGLIVSAATNMLSTNARHDQESLRSPQRAKWWALDGPHECSGFVAQSRSAEALSEV